MNALQKRMGNPDSTRHASARSSENDEPTKLETCQNDIQALAAQPAFVALDEKPLEEPLSVRWRIAISTERRKIADQLSRRQNGFPLARLRRLLFSLLLYSSFFTFPFLFLLSFLLLFPLFLCFFFSERNPDIE